MGIGYRQIRWSARIGRIGAIGTIGVIGGRVVIGAIGGIGTIGGIGGRVVIGAIGAIGGRSDGSSTTDARDPERPYKGLLVSLVRGRTHGACVPTEGYSALISKV